MTTSHCVPIALTCPLYDTRSMQLKKQAIWRSWNAIIYTTVLGMKFHAFTFSLNWLEGLDWPYMLTLLVNVKPVTSRLTSLSTVFRNPFVGSMVWRLPSICSSSRLCNSADNTLFQGPERWLIMTNLCHVCMPVTLIKLDYHWSRPPSPGGDAYMIKIMHTWLSLLSWKHEPHRFDFKIKCSNRSAGLYPDGKQDLMIS